jgi:hypothetical protein
VTCNGTPFTPVTLHYHKLTKLILSDWHINISFEINTTLIIKTFIPETNFRMH